MIKNLWLVTGSEVIRGELFDFKLILIGATRLGGVAPSHSGSSFEGVEVANLSTESDLLLLVLKEAPPVRRLTLREAVRSGPYSNGFL